MTKENALQKLQDYFKCKRVADDWQASLRLAKGEDVVVNLKLLTIGGRRVVIDVYAVKNAGRAWGRLEKYLSALQPTGCKGNEKKIASIKDIQDRGSLIARYDTGKIWELGLDEKQMGGIKKAVAEVCKASGCV